jgi:hypothetical protein
MVGDISKVRCEVVARSLEVADQSVDSTEEWIAVVQQLEEVAFQFVDARRHVAHLGGHEDAALDRADLDLDEIEDTEVVVGDRVDECVEDLGGVCQRLMPASSVEPLD